MNNLLSPLLTDQYELIMAHGYWQQGKAEQAAVFQLFFRTNPFAGNYTVACGLTHIIDFLTNFKFTSSDIAYLEKLTHDKSYPLFNKQFLTYLEQLHFSCSIDAVPEGSLIFPQEPVLVIKGPLLQCQILESALINMMAFSSLIATKASRICAAAKNSPVLEFGLRRAQGPNGAVMASRAAYIGGCDATSNALAGKEFDIPIRGTMGHSWVMAFPDELSAFQAFAEVMKEQTVLLVDTYNTIQGIKNAIIVGTELRRRKLDLLGIRLDSGDLYKLSKKARKMLDKAGFNNTKIFVSGDLDEYKIKNLKAKKAPINAWCAGTRLTTAHGDPALNMVYKLMALHDSDNQWDYKIKISAQTSKTLIPGIQQVRRFYVNDKIVQDVIYDTELKIKESKNLKQCASKHMLVPIFREGKLVYKEPSIHDIRTQAIAAVNNFIKYKIKKYPVMLDDNLTALQKKLMR